MHNPSYDTMVFQEEEIDTTMSQEESNFDPENDLIADYYECLIECDESQSVCKRICKEVLV